MDLYLILISIVILFSVELLYFRLANRYNIIDKPNHRSSHKNVTIRGGGIIFALALLLYPLYGGLIYPYFLFGLFAISFISFIDDIKSVNNKVRITIHLVAVALLFFQLHMFVLPFYWIVLALIFVIGTINAINFMDGINGITGAYGLVTLGTLYYINSTVSFTTTGFLIVSILSVIVFNFFNFRKKAKCFAGDVGSVSLAFVIVFFILQLIIKTQNLSYFLLLLVYGLDTFTTIIFRLIRKENIFEAHRSHFYQFWTNEKGVSHLLIASLYSLIQLLINVLLAFFKLQSLIVLIITVVLSVLIFVCVRFYTEGWQRLVNKQN